MIGEVLFYTSFFQRANLSELDSCLAGLISLDCGEEDRLAFTNTYHYQHYHPILFSSFGM